MEKSSGFRVAGTRFRFQVAGFKFDNPPLASCLPSHTDDLQSIVS